MQIPILIEPVANSGYRARGGELFGFSAEGATREEVLAKLQEQFQARLVQGAVLVPMEISTQPHPLAKFAGMFKDDPDFQEIVQIMAENRKKMDEDPDIP